MFRMRQNAVEIVFQEDDGVILRSESVVDVGGNNGATLI